MENSNWFDYIEIKQKNKKIIYPIYNNPSIKDYIRMKKENGTTSVRYFIDFKNLSLYVFDSEVLHRDAYKKIYKKDSEKLKQKTAFLFLKKVVLPVWGDYGLGASKIYKGKIELIPGILFYLSYMKNKNIFVFLNNFFINIPNFKSYNKKELKIKRREWIKWTYEYEHETVDEFL